MKSVLCLLMGYIIGSISPAAMISAKKRINLKQEGTGNLGATNTTLLIGKKAGFLVLILDMLKSVLSYRLARALFPQLLLAGLIACIGTLLGHCFPVFLHFQGGKGLASFGGMILAYNPWIFLGLLTTGIAIVFLVNYGVAMALYAGALFPITVYFHSHDLGATVLSAVASAFVMFMHRDNVKKAMSGEERQIRAYFKKELFSKKC